MARNVSIERPRGWPLSPLSLAVRQGAGKRPWNVFIKIPELIIYAEQKHNEARFERKERWPSSTGSPRNLAFSFLISALFPSETFRVLNRPTTRRYRFAYPPLINRENIRGTSRRFARDFRVLDAKIFLLLITFDNFVIILLYSSTVSSGRGYAINSIRRFIFNRVFQRKGMVKILLLFLFFSFLIARIT